MANVRAEEWLASSGALRRPGAVSRSLGSSFVEFAPNTGVWPIGRLDVGDRNVGHRIDDVDLVRHDGDISLTGGSTVEGLDIYGRITGNSATAVVRDCIVRGAAPTNAQSWSARGSVDGSFGGATFEFVTFDLTGRESPFANTFEGGDYEARYCDIMRSVDGGECNAGSNVHLTCCRISHGKYFSWWNNATNSVRTTTFTDWGGTVRTAPFPGQSSGDTHSDGWQIMRGQGHHFIGCNIGAPNPFTAAEINTLDPTVEADYLKMIAVDSAPGFNTSALMINGYSLSPLGLLVEFCRLAGGTATVNASPNGADTLSGVTIRNNTFVRQPVDKPNYAILDNGSAATITGNVWEDTGTAVPVT